MLPVQYYNYKTHSNSHSNRTWRCCCDCQCYEGTLSVLCLLHVMFQVNHTVQHLDVSEDCNLGSAGTTVIAKALKVITDSTFVDRSTNRKIKRWSLLISAAITLATTVSCLYRMPSKYQLFANLPFSQHYSRSTKRCATCCSPTISLGHEVPVQSRMRSRWWMSLWFVFYDWFFCQINRDLHTLDLRGNYLGVDNNIKFIAIGLQVSSVGCLALTWSLGKQGVGVYWSRK